MSLVAVLPEPVLSPSRQSDGKTARNEFVSWRTRCSTSATAGREACS